MASVCWILEKIVFPSTYQPLCEAIVEHGYRYIDWDDGWWIDDTWPRIQEDVVIFHGALENADRIRRLLPWQPGSFCNSEAFACSSWYPSLTMWLLHEKWVLSTVEEFVANPSDVAKSLDSVDTVFVRPDSPLKPFSGRVCHLSDVSLSSLDFGFYYDDVRLPIVLAPVAEVSEEWRFIVTGADVIAGSPYQAEGRSAVEPTSSIPWDYTREVAASVAGPETVYVLDVCESRGGLKVLELNPFSGADLYACDLNDVVTEVSRAASNIVINNVRD